MTFTYMIIGVIQACAGFFIYFVIMAENGFMPGKLLGIRDVWNNRDKTVYDSFNQPWVIFNRYFLIIINLRII